MNTPLSSPTATPARRVRTTKRPNENEPVVFDSDLIIEPESLIGPARKAEVTTSFVTIGKHVVPRIEGELWTAGQRQAASIHEVSYRACFKAQLPGYFIRRCTNVGDVVYDPFSGRGTTIIEAALQGRRIIANDANPLSVILARPRLNVPDIKDVENRLHSIPIRTGLRADIDLSMFYHPDTESEIVSLRQYLKERHASGAEDRVDAWIRMVATNRLTGHSTGFFSIYTFPPNQAVSAAAQVKINEMRKQVPEYRDTKAIVLKKSRQLLHDLDRNATQALRDAGETAVFLTGDARYTSAIPHESVQLTVTSPPFLDIVQYADDNWLRCWFNDLDLASIAKSITMSRTVEAWNIVMGEVFKELFRITRPGGYVAFEVGEVRRGKIRLEEFVVPLGVAASFDCVAVLINSQVFTKTANIWGVSNNRAGTNSNRIAVFRKSI